MSLSKHQKVCKLTQYKQKLWRITLWWMVPKKILKYVSYNFTFSILSPLGEGRGPSFGQTRIPSSQWCFVLSLVEIGPVVLEKIKMWKAYRQMDAGQNVIRTFGPGELKCSKIFSENKCNTYKLVVSKCVRHIHVHVYTHD